MKSGYKYLFWMGFLGACNQTPVTPSPTVGSETHWLERCEEDADCGEANACVCGVCTVPCAVAADCAVAGPESLCALAGAPEAAALCGALPADTAGICARGCAGGCPADQVCADAGVCVPVVADNGAPRARLSSQAIHPPARQAVDFLFVIDDSGSMCQEQAALSQAIEAVVPALARLDYRIAVTSTDMQTATARGRFRATPAAPEPSLNCKDEAGEPLVPDTADCDTYLGGQALPEIIGARGTPDLVSLKGWFRCLATLGTQGDGFEKGLAAGHTALDCAGPNRAYFGSCCTESGYDSTACAATPPDFLRPEADLVVVYISDEDDCSDPASAPSVAEATICRLGAEDANADGVPDGYASTCADDPRACFVAECGALTGADCYAAQCAVSRRSNSQCEWGRDSLLAVAAFRADLLALKGDAASVAVWTFVGPRAFDDAGRPLHFEDRPIEPVCDPVSPGYDPSAPLAMCCPEGVCAGEVQTTCESPLGAAFAGHRYLDLAGALPLSCAPGDGRAECGLCPGAIDLAPAFATLPTMHHAACLDSRPACIIPEGLAFRRCANPDERADAGHYTLGVEVACPDCADPIAPRALRLDEFALVETDGCPSGLLFLPAALPPEAAVDLVISR